MSSLIPDGFYFPVRAVTPVEIDDPEPTRPKVPPDSEHINRRAGVLPDLLN